MNLKIINCLSSSRVLTFEYEWIITRLHTPNIFSHFKSACYDFKRLCLAPMLVIKPCLQTIVSPDKDPCNNSPGAPHFWPVFSVQGCNVQTSFLSRDLNYPWNGQKWCPNHCCCRVILLWPSWADSSMLWPLSHFPELQVLRGRWLLHAESLQWSDITAASSHCRKRSAERVLVLSLCYPWPGTRQHIRNIMSPPPDLTLICKWFHAKLIKLPHIEIIIHSEIRLKG